MLRHLRGFGRRKSQSYVVGYPGSIRIPQLGFQDPAYLMQVVFASFLGKTLKEIASKSFQVADDVARQRGGTWDQRHAIDAKSCAFQSCGVVARCGEIPRHASLTLKPTSVQCFDQSSSDLVNTTAASAFRDKSTVRFQRTIHSSKHD